MSYLPTHQMNNNNILSTEYYNMLCSQIYAYNDFVRQTTKHYIDINNFLIRNLEPQPIPQSRRSRYRYMYPNRQYFTRQNSTRPLRPVLPVRVNNSTSNTTPTTTTQNTTTRQQNTDLPTNLSSTISNLFNSPTFDTIRNGLRQFGSNLIDEHTNVEYVPYATITFTNTQLGQEQEPDIRSQIPSQETIANSTTDVSYNPRVHIQTLCPIGLDRFETCDDILMINHCRHIFKKANILRWFQTSPLCPVCRHNILDNTTNNTETNDIGNTNQQTHEEQGDSNDDDNDISDDSDLDNDESGNSDVQYDVNNSNTQHNITDFEDRILDELLDDEFN